MEYPFAIIYPLHENRLERRRVQRRAEKCRGRSVCAIASISFSLPYARFRVDYTAASAIARHSGNSIDSEPLTLEQRKYAQNVSAPD